MLASERLGWVSEHSPDERTLVQERVSVGVGLQTLVGRLTIGAGEIRFVPRSGPPLLNTSRTVTVKTALLGSWGVSTEIELAEAPFGEAVVLRVGRRRARAILAAIRGAGFAVEVHRRLF